MISLPTNTQRTPTELLDAQVQLLSHIYQTQIKQQELLEKISAQQAASVVSSSSQDVTMPGYMKIVDFNMPFFALVGILIKVSLAAIPAAIIVAVIWFALMFGLFFALSLLGVGLNTFFQLLGGR